MNWKFFSILLVLVIVVGYYLDFWGLTEPCRPKTVVKTLPMYINRTVIREVPVEKIVYVNQTVYVNNCSCPTEPEATTTTTVPSFVFSLAEGASVLHEGFNVTFVEGGDRADVGLYKNHCDHVRYAKITASDKVKSVTDLTLKFFDCLAPVDQSDCLDTGVSCDKLRFGNLTVSLMDVSSVGESKEALLSIKTNS